ncbi:c6 zinc finger domain protein [Ophiostoma piceae UAMH 11346]|uniref:C6 zinc finger domain protein n=1 Tax=Ophiostoma piceae (strain UAMH 11346) TaxID=1262450 RepID=S3C461_OPHP1|nr:c6 zinc finger domain protein [Ophiostoma piceae UAMH 11346]
MQDMPLPPAGQPASAPTSAPGAASAPATASDTVTSIGAPAANGSTNGSAHKGARVQSEHREHREPKEKPPGPTVLTFALSQRPRATRLSAPKLELEPTKRRVKCDEAKPSCNRCTKAGVPCAGYNSPGAEAQGATALAVLAPAPTDRAAVPAVPAMHLEPAYARRSPPIAAIVTSTVPPSHLITAGPGPEPAPEPAPEPVVPVPASITTSRSYSTSSSSSGPTEASYGTPHAEAMEAEPLADGTAYATTRWAARSMAPTPPAAKAMPAMIRRMPMAVRGHSIKSESPADDDVRILDVVHIRDGENTQQSSGGFNSSFNSFSQFGGFSIAPLHKRERDDDDDYDANGSGAGNTYLFNTAQPYVDMSCASFPFASRISPDFPLEPNYNSAMFSAQDEKTYFDSWLTLAPNLGGGWFPSHLWTTTIPQLCRLEPAVRYAAIAVGAMAEAMSPALLGKSSYHLTDSTAGDDGPGREASLTAPIHAANTNTDANTSVDAATSVVRHYRNALTFFGHALRLTRLASSDDGNELSPSTTTTGPNGEIIVGHSSEKERAAVMCCLLFVCFEALQGNRENALRHITHGLQIVDQFVARNVPPRALEPHDMPLQSVEQQPAVENGPIPADTHATAAHDAEWQRRKQRQRMRDRQLRLSSTNGAIGDGTPENDDTSASTIPSGEQRPSDALTRLLTRSPAPYILEDEVMQVFRRLDFQAWSLGVFRLRRTRPADIKFQALDALNPATIPDRFDSLDDARRWWDLVQHWVLQFPRYMVAALQRYMDAHPDAEARATAAGRMLDICDVPGASEIQKEYLQCLERWNKAFWPLYDHARCRAAVNHSEHEAAYLKAASLQVPYLLAWIGVKSFVYSDYEAMHDLTPQFRELNRLAALILPRQPRYSWSPFGGGASVSNGGSAAGLHSFGGDLFTMDNGPTMALFVVSCKCRVEAVRDESIRLLAAYPRRDGFWDSKILWAIANWNRVIEAENVTGTPYEQWLRLRQREAIFDETRPQVQMTAWVKNKTTGEFEFKRQIVTWDGR